ncbi:hypothetical protein HDU80_004999 [Chytriomyces hyalinus]|nr:hypothetical protein HDU80_004999 [Chytriomyces hyalinus]
MSEKKKNETQKTSDRPSPEETAPWYMFIGAFWLTAFVKEAAKRPLQFEDVYRLHPVFGARVSTDRLESATNMYYNRAIEKIRAAGKDENAANSPTSKFSLKENALKWALMKGILYAERRKIFIAALLNTMHSVAQICAPILLSNLLKAEIQSPLAYGLAVAIFLVQMVQALGWNNSQYVMKGASMSIFAGLLSMVYRKAFRLGTKGRAQYPTGVIMNLIASDCNSVQRMLQYITDLLCVPLEVISLSIIIIVFAGPAGAAGLSFIILSTVISIVIVSKSYSIEHKALAATDERVKVTGEVINGIKIVKFFAWETAFIERLSLLRDNELVQHLRLRMIEASFSVILNCVPAFTNVLVFSVYRALGNNVDAATVFATLSVINLIRLPIAIVAMVAQGLFTALASLERLAKFFAVEEMDMDRLIELPPGSENAVQFENASFEWSSEKPIEIEDDDDFKKSDDQTSNMKSIQMEALNGPFTLRNINLEIKTGSLTMIVGKVGSGKSSLLGALIGDMSTTNGCVKVSGRFGYTPQASWLQNTTLRANILLGSAFDEARYNETIRCCGLSKDLAILPFGDMSDIGEKGITLSGGQAARVNLARAIYSNADIMLMDDPLAAVDAHVGKQILDECILGVCKSKTVVLVTHQLHIASQADHIVVMNNGEITEQGSFSQLMNARGGFFDLMQEYGHAGDDAEALKTDDAIKETPAIIPIDELKEFDVKGADLNEEEEREVGSVALKHYAFYVKNLGTSSFLVLLFLLFSLWQATRLLGDVWLTFWVEDRFLKSELFYIVGLLLLAALQVVLFGVVRVAFARGCFFAGKNIHKLALAAVMKAPMVFFETNPVGRIISRFSKDFGETDRQLPRLFGNIIEFGLNIIGTFVLIVYASPWMMIVIAAVIPIYMYFLKLYRASLREVKRIEAIARSPLYSQINESFAGISAIRAFGATEDFVSVQESLQDAANRPSYILGCLENWVSTRAETFVACIIGMMAIFGVAFRIDTALLGLALAYSLSLMFLLNFGLHDAAETEARMNSVERLSHYITDLKPEGSPKHILHKSNPPSDWPQSGSLEFINLTLKYRPELEPILHSLSFKIAGGQKVGVVGRTGAGKSSIITALFRLVEFEEGTIKVDGMDISAMDLTCLRSRLSIIPQAPMLFDGTIRSNLDPFSKHTDTELWGVLERCSLHEYISSLPTKLDAPVAEGGTNLSVGQRQLLCLGRALLVKSKILLIDEATASVDMETDTYIQKVLREDFADCTVLCIAHRLNTLMDYDKILVLDSGRLAEFDTPHALASDASSMFSSLLDETGASNAALLRKMASAKTLTLWYMFIGAFWLTGFVKEAAKKPLQFEDVYRLHPVFGARVSTDRLESATNMYYTRAIEKIRAAGKDENAANSPTSKFSLKENALKWALMKGILYAERRKIFIAALLNTMHSVAQICAPIILSTLLKAEIQSPLAYGMAVALFVVQMIQALGWNNSQYVMKGASMSIFAGLLSMVYRKAFRLGTKGRAQYPTGVIMNLIASDCNSVQRMLQYITDLLCVPLEVISLSIIIIVFAGPAGAAGLSFMICCTGISIVLVSKSYSVEHKALAATDERVKVTGEVINGIKIVKFFAWETAFIERLSLLRDNELVQHLRLRMIEASFSVILNCVPAFTNVLVFSVYRALGNNVDAATVFATLSVINLIRLPIAIVAMVAQGLFTALASLERLAKFFAVEEMDMDRLIELPVGSETAVLFENASFKWSSEKPIEIEDDDDFKKSDDQTSNMKSIEMEALNGPFTLRNINLEIKTGSLTMIVGKVGSGKSSLLGALIGDMSTTNGCVKVSGRFGYTPQASWLQNTTLRANILLGSAFDEARYNETIRCCGLSKDLAILPFGDMSDIGEKGITLSGGQAARVNLARAIYSNADIMLMDDPLAAVDAHVGKQILDECILGVCKSKTVVLVTHQLHIASQADHIVVMNNGEITEQGSFSQLMNARGGFFDLMQEYGHAGDDVEAPKADDAIKETPAIIPIDELKEFDVKGTDLNEEEEREVGSVALKHYAFYVKNLGTSSFLVLLFLLFSLWQATKLLGDVWLTFWVEDRFLKSELFYIVGLLLLAALQVVLFGVVRVAFARACFFAGKNIHSQALAAVMKVPMVFFETNPVGRIISRFSKDFGETDRQLPRLFGNIIEFGLNIIGTFILIVYASPWMMIVIAAVIPIYMYFLKLYRASLREVKRIEAITRSPLYSQINESFAGISAIRAFGATEDFVSVQESLQDAANRPSYILGCLENWVSTRAETFVACIIGMMAIFGVAFRIDTALLGLALAYSLSLMFLLNFGLHDAAETEARMNSVERLSHYITDLKPEGSPKHILHNSNPPSDWPQSGSLEFINLTLKYRPELEPILHSLSFKIAGGQKVGVVGRTGAGKSSIITALFRLVEFEEGTIKVDGMDISAMDLTCLRSRLSIIPQAPILFDGTIRSNLDPFSKHTDTELWGVLERCSLHEYISSLPTKLDAPVAEGGTNLSVGQRQLLCLGRALLVKSKILLIDEATASVDMETDTYIQKVLREDFADCTVLCIAHRLNTLMDYDKILVLDSGRLAEFDTPNALASDASSMLSSLLDETGASNAALLRKMASAKTLAF